MSNKILVSDQSKCSGCRNCQVWCSFHHLEECNPSLARLIVVPFEGKGLFVPVICHHCKNPWCMNQCPTDAIIRDDETNAVVIVAEMCNGCRACADTCPFGVIKVSPEGEVFKCDLCDGRPVCVENCTRQALAYVEPTDAHVNRAIASVGRIQGVV